MAHSPVSLLICRAVTADHPPAVVVGAVYREGGYPAGHTPGAVHEHSDAPPFRCQVVHGVAEQVPRSWPHRMANGDQVADEDAYLAHCARHIP